MSRLGPTRRSGATYTHAVRRGVGRECEVGEKTYIADGVSIGDRVKIDAFVYLCDGVVVEDGVMIGAGVVFTNDRYPRATTPDLQTVRQPLRPEAPRTSVRGGGDGRGGRRNRTGLGDRTLRDGGHGLRGDA